MSKIEDQTLRKERISTIKGKGIPTKTINQNRRIGNVLKTINKNEENLKFDTMSDKSVRRYTRKLLDELGHKQFNKFGNQEFTKNEKDEVMKYLWNFLYKKEGDVSKVKQILQKLQIEGNAEINKFKDLFIKTREKARTKLEGLSKLDKLIQLAKGKKEKAELKYIKDNNLYHLYNVYVDGRMSESQKKYFKKLLGGISFESKEALSMVPKINKIKRDLFINIKEDCSGEDMKLNEMAEKHISPSIAIAMRNGDYKIAAKKYLENMMKDPYNYKASALGLSFKDIKDIDDSGHEEEKQFITNLAARGLGKMLGRTTPAKRDAIMKELRVTEEQLKGFEKAVEDYRDKYGVIKNEKRKPVSSSTEVTPGVSIEKTGHKQSSRIKNVSDSIYKTMEEIKRQNIDNMALGNLRLHVKEILDGYGYKKLTKPPKDDEVASYLWSFIYQEKGEEEVVRKLAKALQKESYKVVAALTNVSKGAFKGKVKPEMDDVTSVKKAMDLEVKKLEAKELKFLRDNNIFAKMKAYYDKKLDEEEVKKLKDLVKHVTIRTNEAKKVMEGKYEKFRADLLGSKKRGWGWDDDEEEGDEEELSQEKIDKKTEKVEKGDRIKLTGANYMENYSFKQKMLIESTGYSGNKFWENYTLTGLIKAFARDTYVYSPDTAKKMYEGLLGEEFTPILDYMLENYEFLLESSLIKSPILFEETGKYNVEKYLGESINADVMEEDAVTKGIRGLVKLIKKAKDKKMEKKTKKKEIKELMDASKNKMKANPKELAVFESFIEEVCGINEELPDIDWMGLNAVTKASGKKSIFKDILKNVDKKELKDFLPKTKLKVVETKNLEKAISGFKESMKNSIGTGVEDIARAKDVAAGGSGILATAAPTSGIMSFLKNVWEGVKSLGVLAFDKIKEVVAIGVPWAKDLLSKGASWLATSPLAQAALPLVAIGGGVGAGILILNKIRKKMGKEKLSRQERENFKKEVDKKKKDIEELKKKGIKISLQD